MSRPEAKLALKNSIVSVADDFFQVLQLDVAINFKRIICAFVFSLSALLFGFLIWLYLIYYLYDTLLLQSVSHEGAFFITLAINVLMLIVFWIASRRQLSKIKFLYTTYAMRKIIKTLGAKNEP